MENHLTLNREAQRGAWESGDKLQQRKFPSCQPMGDIRTIFSTLGQKLGIETCFLSKLPLRQVSQPYSNRESNPRKDLPDPDIVSGIICPSSPPCNSLAGLLSQRSTSKACKDLASQEKTRIARASSIDTLGICPHAVKLKSIRTRATLAPWIGT